MLKQRCVMTKLDLSWLSECEQIHTQQQHRDLKVETWCDSAALLSSLLRLESPTLLLGRCLSRGLWPLFSPRVAGKRQRRGGAPRVSPVLQCCGPSQESSLWELGQAGSWIMNWFILVLFSPIKSREDRIIDLLVQMETSVLFFPNEIAV